ncbi:MAG: hypothetical protein IJC25_00445 [Clostridia bacterium]|nr:hypothetical protein [Clostridia bacterium]
MNIAPPQKKQLLRLPKKRWMLAVWCIALIIAVSVIVRTVPPVLWPGSHYPVQKVIDMNVYVPYGHTYEPLDPNDAAQLEVLGVSPVPGYVPEGYRLKTAELITDENAHAFVDARAVKLTYSDTKNRKKQFYLTVSAEERFTTKFEQASLDTPMAFANQGETVWAVFGDTDVIVYHNKPLKQYFCRFQANGHEWLLCCTNMTKKEVRLIATSVLEQ